MPDRQITIKVSLDGLTDASTAAKGFTSDVQGIGTAATEATSAAAPLGAVVDKAATSLKTASGAAGELTGVLKDKLGPAGEAAQAAFEKLGNVQGLRGLSISIVQAQNAMDAFKKSVADAEASGTKMPPAVGNALKAMQGEITGATQKLGDLRKSQQDLAATSALAGSQLDKLRQSGTSLTGMFESMERTGSGVTKAIGQLGMGLGIAAIAFVGAEIAGKKLGEAIDWVAAKNEKLSDTHNKTRASTELHAVAMRTLDAGLIKNSDTVAGLIKNYELYIMSHGRASIAAKKHADDVLGLNDALLTEAGIVAQSEESAARLAGIEEEAARATANVTKAEENLATVRATMPAKIGRVMDAEIALMLAKDTAGKKQAEYNLAVEKAAPAINAEVAAYRALGDAMPPALRKASDALDALKKAHDDATEAMKKAIAAAKELPPAMQKSIENAKLLADEQKKNVDGWYSLAAANEKYYGSLDRIIEREKAMAEALKKSNAEFANGEAVIKARNAAIDAATASVTTHTDSMERLGAGTVAASGTMATMTTKLSLLEGTFFSVAAATDAQNTALENLLKTQNAYGAAVEKTLDVAKGWKDYLAGLADAYRTGAMDLLQYKNRLVEFQTQLQMLFTGATGEARKAIEAMTGAIQQLINTAGGGPQGPFDMSPTGQLNRTFNNPPAKP